MFESASDTHGRAPKWTLLLLPLAALMVLILLTDSIQCTVMMVLSAPNHAQLIVDLSCPS